MFLQKQYEQFFYDMKTGPFFLEECRPCVLVGLNKMFNQKTFLKHVVNIVRAITVYKKKSNSLGWYSLKREGNLVSLQFANNGRRFVQTLTLNNITSIIYQYQLVIQLQRYYKYKKINFLRALHSDDSPKDLNNCRNFSLNELYFKVKSRKYSDKNYLFICNRIFYQWIIHNLYICNIFHILWMLLRISPRPTLF